MMAQALKTNNPFEKLIQIIAIEKEMKNPKQFIKPLGIGNICCTISNLSVLFFGIMGYLTYGNAIQINVVFSFSTYIPIYVIAVLNLTQILCIFPLYGLGIMSILMKELIIPRIKWQQPNFVELPLRYFAVLVSCEFCCCCSWFVINYLF